MESTKISATNPSYSIITIEKSMPIIWVALAVIAASALTISLLSHFSYLPITVGYSSIAISGISLSALALSYVFRPNCLKKALNAATTFKELKNLIDQPGIETKVSFFGSRIISLKGRMGGIKLNALAIKVEKMVAEKKFIYPEEERVEGEGLVKSITGLFETSDKILKFKNFITSAFHEISVCPSQIVYTFTIHDRWLDLGGAYEWFDSNPDKRPKERLGRWYA